MKPIRSLLLLAMAAFLSACVGNSASDPTPSSEEAYTITWKNYDGTVLEIDEGVGRYEWPTYDGATPTKPKDEEHNYVFSGWTPEVDYTVSDTEYTATFTEEPRTYTITWKDSNGNTLGQGEYDLGDMPYFRAELPAVPSETPPENYSYTWFWSPEVTRVTGDAEYVGKYGLKLNDSAFEGLTSITEFAIPEGVIEIGDSAFAGCTGLTSITIPEGVTAIGENAFEGCTALSEVHTPSLSAWLGIYFGGYGANPVSNSSANLYIGDSTEPLSGSFAIPEGTTEIGDYAFHGFAGLTSLTIPSSVTSIGYAAFEGCDGLTSISLPSSPLSIRDHAFDGCLGLSKVQVPTLEAWLNITFIGDRYGASPLENDNAKLYIGDATEPISGDLVIPDGFTSIPWYAFHNCTGLTSVTIPSSVTSIASWAFSGCTGLTSMTIPEWVTYIGVEAFSYCTGLTSVTIPSNMTSINYGVFRRCTSLTSVTIPSSVTSIDSWAFSGCVEVTFAGTASQWDAIDGSSGVDAFIITFSDGTSRMNDDFQYVGEDGISYRYDSSAQSWRLDDAYHDDDITTAVIPASIFGYPVASIGDRAFWECTGLTSITIPDSVTSIGEYAFSGCTSLASITVPDSVTSIGSYAFSGCSSLTEISYSGTASQWDAIEGRSNVNGVIIALSDGTSRITDDYLYVGEDGISYRYDSSVESWRLSDAPTDITTAVIPASILGHPVASIGGYAFSGCSALSSVVIRGGVTSIGNNAFSGCTSLTKVYYGSINVNTEADWDKIEIGSGNDALTADGVTRYYYTGSTETEPGNWWYFDNGAVVENVIEWQHPLVSVFAQIKALTKGEVYILVGDFTESGSGASSIPTDMWAVNGDIASYARMTIEGTTSMPSIESAKAYQKSGDKVYESVVSGTAYGDWKESTDSFPSIQDLISGALMDTWANPDDFVLGSDQTTYVGSKTYQVDFDPTTGKVTSGSTYTLANINVGSDGAGGWVIGLYLYDASATEYTSETMKYSVAYQINGSTSIKSTSEPWSSFVEPAA